MRDDKMVLTDMTGTTNKQASALPNDTVHNDMAYNDTAHDKEIVKKMRTLIATLKKHNHAYYVLDNPTILDSEYDSLRQALMALEADYPKLIQPDSPLNQVGDKPLPFFNQIKHDIPMLSLGNVFNRDEMADFDRRAHERIGQIDEYEIELKAGWACGVFKIRAWAVFSGGNAWRWDNRRGYYPKCTHDYQSAFGD